MPDYIPRPILDRLSKLPYTQALDIFLRSLDMVSRAVTEYRLEVDKPDIIIRPLVTHIDILEDVDVHEVAKIGEDATQAVLPEIRSLFSWQNRLRRAVGV